MASQTNFEVKEENVVGGGFLLLDDFGGSETYTARAGGETDSFYELDDDEDDGDDDSESDIDFFEMEKRSRKTSSKILHKCCGTVPHWRPYKPSTKKCCSDGTLISLSGQCG